MLDSVGGLFRVECRWLLETCVVSTLEGLDNTKDELNALEELDDIDVEVEALEELGDVEVEVEALEELDLVVGLEDIVGRLMIRGTDVVDNYDREVLVLELWIDDCAILPFVSIELSITSFSFDIIVCQHCTHKQQ